jgi:glycine/serine hydroxymethyltransferase
MEKIGALINRVIDNVDNKAEIEAVHRDVVRLCADFPIYPELA